MAAQNFKFAPTFDQIRAFSATKFWLTCPTLLLVDQSSTDFFRQTREELREFTDFGHLRPFRRYSRSKSEVVLKRAEFCTFLAPDLSWEKGGPSNFGT